MVSSIFFSSVRSLLAGKISTLVTGVEKLMKMSLPTALQLPYSIELVTERGTHTHTHKKLVFIYWMSLWSEFGVRWMHLVEVSRKYQWDQDNTIYWLFHRWFFVLQSRINIFTVKLVWPFSIFRFRWKSHLQKLIIKHLAEVKGPTEKKQLNSE